MLHFRKRRPEGAAPVIDPAGSWKPIEDRLAITTDPRHRQIMETVIENMQQTAVANLDGVMATLAPDPAFRFWDDGDDIGPKTADGVRAYYDGLFQSHSYVLEFAIDRMFIDSGGMVTEGFLRQIYPGQAAFALGLIADDPGSDYLIEFRQLIIWNIDADGRIQGEDSYNSGPSRVMKLTREQLPQTYVEIMNAHR